jgi:hypothetical protein
MLKDWDGNSIWYATSPSLFRILKGPTYLRANFPLTLNLHRPLCEILVCFIIHILSNYIILKKTVKAQNIWLRRSTSTPNSYYPLPFIPNKKKRVDRSPTSLHSSSWNRNIEMNAWSRRWGNWPNNSQRPSPNNEAKPVWQNQKAQRGQVWVSAGW